MCLQLASRIHPSFGLDTNPPLSPSPALSTSIDAHRDINTMADHDHDHDHDGQAEDSRLRERPSAKPHHARQHSDDAKQRVLALNEQEDKGHEDGREKRTYGRTPDGIGTWPRSGGAQEKLCRAARRTTP